MTGSRSLAALVLGLSSIYLYSSESPLRSFGQVIVDKSRLVHWQDSAPKNNDCIVDQIANACEDVKIHFASNTAFLACGDPLERTKWYPGALRHDAAGRSEASFRENLFKYDIKTRKTTELRVDGLEGDFVTHGMDIFEAPGDASKVCERQPPWSMSKKKMLTTYDRFTFKQCGTQEVTMRSASSHTLWVPIL